MTPCGCSVELFHRCFSFSCRSDAEESAGPNYLRRENEKEAAGFYVTHRKSNAVFICYFELVLQLSRHKISCRRQGEEAASRA